jgi:peptidoglycan-associated lipoprotein
MRFKTPLQTLGLLVCLLALAACASKVRLDDLPPVDNRSTSTGQTTTTSSPNTTTTPDTTTGTGNPTQSGSSTAIKTVQTVGNDTVQPMTGLLAQRSIYFDYDSFGIKEEAKAVLDAHAQYLSKNKPLKVSLEGHTDERGGREYNLALGQKRANAVQQALQLLGVQEVQMEAVSFGKEKPKAAGSTEADFAENRRVDIQYK